MSFTNVGNVCFTRGSNSMGSIGGSAGPAALNVRFQNNAQQSAMMQTQRVVQNFSFPSKPDSSSQPKSNPSHQVGSAWDRDGREDLDEYGSIYTMHGIRK